jgi:lysophospholipase L1-like esterase
MSVTSSLDNSYAENTEKKSMLSFGDSIANGFGVGENNSYAFLFSSQNKYSIVNYAKDGAKSSDLLELLESGECAEAITKADLITICIGANDILSLLNIFHIFQYPVIFLNTEFTKNMQIAIDEFEENLKLIMKHFKKTQARVVFLTIYNPFSGIVIETQGGDIAPFNLGLFSELWLEKINAIIREKCTTFDMFNEIENYKGDEKLKASSFSSSEINLDSHLTLEGQQHIAAQLQRWITPYEQELHINNQNPPKTPIWALILILLGSVITISIILLIFVKCKKTHN